MPSWVWSWIGAALVGAVAVLGGAVGSAHAQSGGELCGVRLEGSTTLGEALAPAVAEALLRYNKYEVSRAVTQQGDGGAATRIIGVNGPWRCTVDILANGSGYAFRALAAGRAEIGLSSRQIRAGEIEALRAAGAGDFVAAAAEAEHVVALDGIAILVHPLNSVPALTKDQVRRIFLGEIVDWSEVGGPPGRIERHIRDEQSGTFQFFAESVLADDPRWAEQRAAVRAHVLSSELVQAVAVSRQAIGFVGAAFTDRSVRTLAVSDGGPAFLPTDDNVRAEDYPISRRLYLYVRPETFRQPGFVNALINHFKSADAYRIARELHFVSLQTTASRPAAPAGCVANTAEAEVYRTATLGGQRLSSVIRFLPGSLASDSLARDDITRARPQVERAIREGFVVRLIGHSDAYGDEALNRRLALDRAAAIRVEFERQGVFGLQVESAGEMCPVASNDTNEGRRSNRRVEIWLVKPGV